MTVNYYEYIKSKEWLMKKRKFLLSGFYNGRCFCCWKKFKKGVKRNIHHLRYTNLGEERLKDLVALCTWCHHAVHFEKSGKKRVLNGWTTYHQVMKLQKKLKNSRHGKKRNDLIWVDRLKNQAHREMANVKRHYKHLGYI